MGSGPSFDKIELFFREFSLREGRCFREISEGRDAHRYRPPLFYSLHPRRTPPTTEQRLPHGGPSRNRSHAVTVHGPVASAHPPQTRSFRVVSGVSPTSSPVSVDLGVGRCAPGVRVTRRGVITPKPKCGRQTGVSWLSWFSNQSGPQPSHYGPREAERRSGCGGHTPPFPSDHLRFPSDPP